MLRDVRRVASAGLIVPDGSDAAARPLKYHGTAALARLLCAMWHYRRDSRRRLRGAGPGELGFAPMTETAAPQSVVSSPRQR